MMTHDEAQPIHGGESSRRMAEETEHANFIAATRESEDAVKRGEVQDLDEAFSDILDSFDL